jgi:hypothetical protein
MSQIVPCVIAVGRWASRPARTPMIPSNAVLPVAFGEQLPVRPSEQRQVVGQEQPSEQRSAGQPGYLGESPLHLRRHRAPISATQPTATRRTDLLRTDIRATPSPVMAIRATRETPLTPLLRAMDTKATQDSQLTPPRVTDRQAIRDTPPTPDPRPLRRQVTQDGQLTQVVRAMDIRARRPIIRTPVTEIRSLAIPAIALRRTGRLGPSTQSSPLAEASVSPQKTRSFGKDSDKSKIGMFDEWPTIGRSSSTKADASQHHRSSANSFLGGKLEQA